jgi:phosphoglycolate phosphatase
MIHGVIFDFDGTMADTQQSSIDIYNILAAKYGYQVFDEAEVARLRASSWKELIKASRVPMRKIPKLLAEGQGILEDMIRGLPPIDLGLPDVLRELRSDMGVLGVISSNTKTNIRAFFDAHDIDVFDFIASAALFSKRKAITHALRKYGLPADNALYVGDEVRDIEAAHMAGLRCVAVDWGFNTPSALMGAAPSYMISDIRELTQIIRSENHPV